MRANINGTKQNKIDCPIVKNTESNILITLDYDSQKVHGGTAIMICQCII